jgi:hypothetical protein
MILEFCCDPNSNMGKVGAEMGLTVCRLFKEVFDLSKPAVLKQILSFVRDYLGISLWGSLPCTIWCNWQHMNAHKHGEPYIKKLKARRSESMRLFASFVTVARAVRKSGGSISFERPKGAVGWAQPQVSKFINEFNLTEASVTAAPLASQIISGTLSSSLGGSPPPPMHVRPTSPSAGANTHQSLNIQT